jgi:hypothetical protein
MGRQVNEIDITISLSDAMYRELETAAFRTDMEPAKFAEECIETVLAERRTSRRKHSRLI